MDLKLLFGTLSLLIGLAASVPYIRDVLMKKTTPHMYSWLVWTILQMTAAIAILRDNSLVAALGVLALGFVSLSVFLLSFKYGTKNVTKFDTACLVGALGSIGLWVFVHNVTLSIVLVTLIDFVGFLPTYRKGYAEPHTETIFLYICSGISNFFSVLAITTYSIESTLYVASLVLSNIIFVTIVLVRRHTLKQTKIVTINT